MTEPLSTPTPPLLPSLATQADIEARLGRTLNPTEAARVNALLADASAIIRRYCREDFLWHANDTIVTTSDGGVINMGMWKPITAITSVTALSGFPSVPDLPVTWYVFDDIAEINIPAPQYAGIINLPEVWYEETFWWGNSFKIAGSHGYQQTPDDVMSVLCPAIVSELSTPTQSATRMSESIGAYSYSMRRTSGAGLSAALTDAGMKTVLSDYRQTRGTMKVRM